MDWFDLFFSRQGRIGRRTWGLGMAVAAAATAVGSILFNEASFDESANAIEGAPTTAAFIWVTLCVYAAVALSTKRLRDAGHSPWLGNGLAAVFFILTAAWGLGFTSIGALDEFALIAFALAATALPVLIACALSPSAAQGPRSSP